MDEGLAHEVYQVLTEECGAADDADALSSFVANHRDGRVDEYRFMGSLGFGGKFWQRDMRVSCYREDESPERLAMIEKANARLSELAGYTRTEHQ